MTSFCGSAYTSEGFVNFCENSYSANNFRYILKGHSPDLKSQLFYALDARLSDAGYEHTVIKNCFGTPASILCGGKKLEIIDGTYPFSAEPVSYGSFDKIIDISSFQNIDGLKKESEKIRDLLLCLKKQEHRAIRFLAAAAGVRNDCRRIDAERTDRRKLNRFSSKLWSKYGERPNGSVGMQKKVFDDTSEHNIGIFDACERVVIINDDFGFAAQSVTEKIRAYALSSGFDVLSFMSICDPYGTPEHIIVPGIGLGIFTKSCSQKICPVGKKIHAERFYQREKAGLEKNRLAFGKKAFKGLVDEAYKSIKEIENINAELDKIYLPHTQINALIASVLRTVLGSD